MMDKAANWVLTRAKRTAEVESTFQHPKGVKALMDKIANWVLTRAK